jgi:CheY-like chemotaxis protein
VSARILVVEDSPDIRVLIQMLLETAGHEVLTASDGQAGVEAAKRERPDLVLMDLSLPVLSGWEATRAIKESPETASIPVVAVTAHAMHGDRERAIAAGCDGFIAKPIDEETFESLVGSYLRAPVLEETSLPEAEPSATSSRSGPAEPGRILVVDDHAEVAEIIRHDLESDAHTVVVARTLDEASTLAREGEQFDLAIVDVMLGPDSGYDLTAELVSRSGEYLPVLLVTAGEIDREKGFAAGADDFVAKPLDPVELVARARSLIRVGRAIRSQGRAARERSEAYEKLAELDRLKSDFLSTVSHELRTPLNTIILLSHLIEREGKNPADEERRLHDIHVIRESAETLLRMINNILDLARLEAGQRDLHPQVVPLRALIQETADLLEPQAREKGLSLDVVISPDLPETAVLDREKVFRVLINLLSNAVKYTTQGSVTVRAAPWQESITFEVEDTGNGVPAHLVATVFEPFRQIRTGHGESARGTGLGLTISKQLVELMGGDLIFVSREGEGTRVSLTLPQLRGAVAEAPETPVSGEPPGPAGETGRGRKVLVVEDDASSRYGLRSLLEAEGYEVVEAALLSEAEDVVRSSPPDALILDITLPDGDGAEWLQLWTKREGRPSFPVIALTGITADEDTRRIEQSGVSAVLQKPVNVGQLLQALRKGGAITYQPSTFSQSVSGSDS